MRKQKKDSHLACHRRPSSASVRIHVELSLWLTRRVFADVRSDLIQGKVGEYGVGDNVGWSGGGGGGQAGRCFYTESSAKPVPDFSLAMSVI
jgi:hypothetical protein